MDDNLNQKMIKILEEGKLLLAEAQAEIRELKDSLRAARLGTKDWQDKHERLLQLIHHPQGEDATLIGFQVRDHWDGSPPAPYDEQDVFDILSAADVLLSLDHVDRYDIVPVFKGEIENPVHVDRLDIEDGDV